MNNFITHDLEKHILKCKGCYERVEIPLRVRRARMPQEAVLIFKPRHICLRVTDDGCGFDVSRAERLRGHFGLWTMRERAARIQGSLKIRSNSSEGTSIEVIVPGV